jgi:hypothetical protein
MSKSEKAALNNDAIEFVRKVVTEVYGQRATKSTVTATARRVVATLPSKSDTVVSTNGSDERAR